jgi:hypothetical protein
MTRLAAVALILLVALSASHADTTWVAEGDARGGWTSEDSPYMVAGHLQIVGRDTLHVGPGVEVFFTGPYRVYVYGVLEIAGSREAPAVFTTDTTVNPDGSQFWSNKLQLLHHRKRPRYRL